MYKKHGIPLFLGRHGLLSRIKTNVFNKVSEERIMETNLPSIPKHHNNNLILFNNNHTHNKKFQPLNIHS
jgi:hypothetical protein